MIDDITTYDLVNHFPGLTTLNNGTTPPGAHPFLAKLTPALSTLVHAKAATHTLETLEHREPSVVVALPTWIWLKAAVHVGRSKGRSLLPARVVWSTGPVAVINNATTITWHVRALGHELTGATRIIPTDDGVPAVTTGDGHLPTAVTARRLSSAKVRTLLGDMADDASRARWSTAQMLEPFVRDEVDKARYSLARELQPHDTHLNEVFDEIERDTVVAELMFGAEGTQGTSRILRLIDKCCEPNTFMNVDPVRYLATAIHRDAFDAARQRIGDPRVGPRVRRVAADHSLNSVEAVVEKYRALHPEDSLSYSRAARALSAGSHMSARTQAVEPSTLPSLVNRDAP